MRLVLVTIFVATLFSAGLGFYATNAYSEDKMEEKTGQVMETAENADKAPYDVQFIDTMVLHHRSAISMAKLAAAKTANPQLKELSNKIVTQQTVEITEMEKLRAATYPSTERAENMELTGMKTSIEDMDMKKLEEAEGTNFDKLYIQMMVTHHRGGIAMANDASKKVNGKLTANRLAALAKKMADTQTAEIAQLESIYKGIE